MMLPSFAYKLLNRDFDYINLVFRFVQLPAQEDFLKTKDRTTYSFLCWEQNTEGDKFELAEIGKAKINTIFVGNINIIQLQRL
jgi:hypothetical protein